MALDGKKRLIMVDMEQKLLDDKSGAYRRELLNKLRGYESDINSLIGDGIDPEKFAAYDKLKKAIKEAVQVIEKFR
ncbi:MAG: hypothetical protein K2L13_01855 [Opitutales bacterium]|nr:hypothetical protein [Opitutales bacterium]